MMSVARSQPGPVQLPPSVTTSTSASRNVTELPVYLGVGAPALRAGSSSEEEPEEALLRLLRMPCDARIALMTCTVTWLPNSYYVLVILAQVMMALDCFVFAITVFTTIVMRVKRWLTDVIIPCSSKSAMGTAAVRIASDSRELRLAVGLALRSAVDQRRAASGAPVLHQQPDSAAIPCPMHSKALAVLPSAW